MSFDLRRARFERGLTMTQVAKGSGVSRKTLTRLERGTRPSAPTAKALADFFGVPVTVVANFDVEPEQEAAA